MTEQLTPPRFQSEAQEGSWEPGGASSQDLKQGITSAFFLLFSVGPLHSDLEYTVSSQKEGYCL